MSEDGRVKKVLFHLLDKPPTKEQPPCPQKLTSFTLYAPPACLDAIGRKPAVGRVERSGAVQVLGKKKQKQVTKTQGPLGGSNRAGASKPPLGGPRGPRGIWNRTEKCYAISTLQALFCTEDFAEQLCRIHYQRGGVVPLGVQAVFRLLGEIPLTGGHIPTGILGNAKWLP